MLGELRLPESEEAAQPTAAQDAWLDRPLLAVVTWERALYALFILIAVISRFYDMGARVMSHDESLHTYFSYLLATGKGFQHTPLMHGPFLFHITALSYFLFGADDFTSRIPTAVFGVVLVALPYAFRRWLGRVGALATSFMLLISPSILYHARYIRQEEFILVWMTLTVLCMWRYLDDRQPGWLVGLTAALAFHATDKATSFLAVALLMVFLSALALWQLYRGRRGLPGGRRWQDPALLVGFGAITAVFMVSLSILFELVSSALARALGVIVPPTGVPTAGLSTLAYIAVMVVLAALVCVGLAYFYRVTFGGWLRVATRHAPAFNVIIVLVTTTMFMGSPAMLLIKNRIWQVFRGEELVPISTLGNMSNLQMNPQVITTMFAMALALIAIAIAIGVTWDWRRWLVIASVFLAITVTLFTTVFTNPAGLGTGFVGQLGYWMAQQDVQRGNQPWYYYFLLVPMYEYTVLVGALCAMATLAVRSLLKLRARLRLLVELRRQRFPLFLAWWTVATWIIYTIAGEKMPWLVVHFALPMAFLTGWFIQRVGEALLGALRSRPAPTYGRLAQGFAMAGLAMLAVLLFTRALSLIGSLDLAGRPVADALQWALSFAIGAIALIAVGYGLGRVANGAGLPAVGLAGFALLSALTVRTAVMVTYINYDYTREFLFYAHGAPGVKIALSQIDDLQKRIGGREPLRVGYTQETSWPMSWYMQRRPGAQFLGSQLPPNYEDFDAIIASEQDAQFAQFVDALATNYVRFDYMLVWWPMQDYYGLNWERISYSLFNPQARAALWEIAFNRNFEPYAKLFGKTSLTPENWSPGHRFSLFIRSDIADRLWDYRSGTIAGGQARPAIGPSLQNPAGIAFAPDGTRFIVDRRANRVFQQDADGRIVRSFGGFGNQPGKFNDPWGIAVDEATNIYVADTFNHRIQKFDATGHFVTAWGRPGATSEPGFGTDTQFFGPRDIAFDRAGRLLVTDTGNKRVQVFDRDGNFITQFGGGGSAEGQFDEPVGIAVDAAGNIYVADTWNRRIQVFDPDYRFLRAWRVAAWERMDEAELRAVDHKPYLAIHGNTLFVSSPRTAQVLAYTLTGTSLQLPGVTFDADDRPTGLKVHAGTLFVTNLRNGTVVEFPLGAGLQ
ncbi:MAG: TIGR03663 family protein [Thermoflexales bacterium]|nr:TIGR03663 family protein [Thermoflexales bacterium]